MCVGWSRRSAGAAIASLILASNYLMAAEAGNMIRPAGFAGSWYPGGAEELAKYVDGLLDKAPATTISGKPIAVIAPHAGYPYSAAVAAAGYRCLRGQSYKRVIGIAFSHRYAGSYQGVDVPREWTAYKTPLGEVPVDGEACEALLKKPGFVSKPGVDGQEHSLELQLPFLQRTLKNFRLVPLYVGRMKPGDYTEAAKGILPLLDEDTLIVVSTDFTHYGPNYDYVPFKGDVPGKLREYADAAAAAIQNGDVDGFLEHLAKTDDTICGRNPVTLLLRTLSMRAGATGVRTAFDTSGNMTGDYANSVTYQSFVFTRRPGTLGAPEREALLKLARETVTAVLGRKPPPSPKAEDLPAGVRKDGACFVTLQNRGELRGCIGTMIAQGPLYQAVIHNAIAAATEDPRFFGNPVTAGELPQIHIEISYLTPMKRITDVREVIIGRHGLHIVLGYRRGVLLPQVAYERGWSRDEFLTQVCHKAGLPPDAWKDPKAELSTFEAEVFGEPEHPATQPGARQ